MPVIKRCDACSMLKDYIRVTMECGHIVLWSKDRPFVFVGQTVVGATQSDSVPVA